MENDICERTTATHSGRIALNGFGNFLEMNQKQPCQMNSSSHINKQQQQNISNNHPGRTKHILMMVHNHHTITTVLLTILCYIILISIIAVVVVVVVFTFSWSVTSTLKECSNICTTLLKPKAALPKRTAENKIAARFQFCSIDNHHYHHRKQKQPTRHRTKNLSNKNFWQTMDEFSDSVNGLAD